MSIIKILDSLTTNQIAAGEVVERPSSVVKELCENSFDANASSVFVEIKNGGINSIKITDNGCGMDKEDLELAFKRHSTSKLNSVMDFDFIKSFGFRGEALASIAAVSKVKITSKRKQDDFGYFLYLEAGEILQSGPIGCSNGTTITVESLFFNTPARYKFLKKDYTESSYIADIMERFALSRPDVSISLINNGKEILKSPGNADLKSAIFSVYGKNITNELITVNYEDENLKIFGFVGSKEICRSNRQHQSVFVNDRYIKSSTVTAALDEAYKTLLMRGKYPFCVIKIEISPAKVDVNVHPQKIQVKFWNEQDVFRSIYHSVQNALLENKANDESDIAIVSEPNAVYEQTTKKSEIINKEEEKYEDPNSKIQIEIPFKNIKNENISVSNASNNFNTIPEEKKQKSDVMISEDMIYKGVLFNTYLMFEKNEYFILIDQHAAHERILFEKLLIMHQSQEIKSQTLLEPIVVEMTSNEVLFFRDNLYIFNELGFECEEFGNNSVILRAVPLGEISISPQLAFKGVFDTISNTRLEKNEIINEALYTIACKAAVKANDKLDELEVKSLIEQMNNTKRANACPHGRPTSIKVNKKEIEKWFKRIV